jgi:hypothetical protein
VVILQTLENDFWVLHPHFAIYYIFSTHQACIWCQELLRPAKAFTLIWLSEYYWYIILYWIFTSSSRSQTLDGCWKKNSTVFGFYVGALCKICSLTTHNMLVLFVWPTIKFLCGNHFTY